ncbi:MAG: hypothetical protein LUH53_06825 [Lachnospiraceae bacterium]|nr:hypothetical protein [Lachnospiraceae bacterium]
MYSRKKVLYGMALFLALITFMKTDCVRVSAQSVSDVTENTESSAYVIPAEDTDLISAEDADRKPSGDGNAAATADLTELHADFLSEGDYQYAEQFGENLLLIRMYVPETDDTTAYIDGDGELFYEENFCWQFDLYSPEENTVIASLNTEEQAADFYQINGTRLLLADYEKQQISSYDAALSLLASYDISAFLDDSDGFVYASVDEDSWYFLNYEEHCIQKAVYVSGSESPVGLLDGNLDEYCSVIQMASPDGSKLLLSVVDDETYLSSCQVVEADALLSLRSYLQPSFFWQTISDDAFLAQLSDEAGTYFCDWFEGEAVYFAMPEDYSVSLAEDCILAVRDNLYAGEDGEPVYSASLYDSTGACVSSMSFLGDRDGDGETDVYMLSEPMYIREQNSIFWLMGEMTGEEESDTYDTYLLWWNLEADSENAGSVIFYDTAAEASGYGGDAIADGTDASNAGGEDTESDDAEIVIILGEDTDLHTEDASDVLADIQSRADALEEAYGISIYLGAEVPEQVGNYYTETCLDTDTLEAAMDQLEMILALYPEDFFPQLLYDDLRGIRIYFSGTLSGDMEGMLTDPGAYVEEIDYYQVMVLDVNQWWNWDYMVNHEISHMIDRSLEFRSMYQKDALFSEETWSSYNPDGFEYLYTYDGYEENAGWAGYAEYFVDSYGTTFATEDRAELFGTAMSSFLNDGLFSYLFEEGSVLREKLDYYCACIRDGFDTAGWEETTAWEAY